MKRFVGGVIVGIIATILLGFCGVYLYLYTGAFPVGADNPPGKLERSMANMAVDQAVGSNAPKQENPTQINSANLIEGAREYEEHCSFCHGGAKSKTSPLAHSFNPPVPQIINRVPHDDDSDLFWITKHGIRMTGMPTWDKHLTDEEIWKIIAFVKHSNALPPDVQAAWQQAAEGPKSGEAHVGDHDESGEQSHSSANQH
jgi:mono/diheme cytochrome c family protein